MASPGELLSARNTHLPLAVPAIGAAAAGVVLARPAVAMLPADLISIIDMTISIKRLL